MLRSTPLRARPVTATRVLVRRPKKCENPHCGKPFLKERMGQRACSPLCAVVVGRLDSARQERKQDKVRRAKLKTRSDYLAEAQQVANAYVRARDRLAGHPCISSGRPLDWSGNAVDAGHYRSVGSAPHLRFNLWNIHAQSKHQNQWLSGNAVDYRIGLILRIGLEKVEALEADNTPRKYSVEWLKRFISIFKKKTKRTLRRLAHVQTL